MLVTPARLRAVYVMLVQFPPFNRWSLPPAGEVVFYNITDPKDHGAYNFEKGKHRIGVNGETCADLIHVERVMAHELVHLRQELLGRRPSTKDDQHNREFYRMARLVCRNLGYQSEGF